MISKLGQNRAKFLAALTSMVVVLGCVLAIISTYGRISQTWDEPNHIATGVEWLQDGTYSMWTENPPLARVAVALGPFLSGARLPRQDRSKSDIETDDFLSFKLGNRLLYEHGSYRRQLVLARTGTLPFFLLAAAVIWFWLVRHHVLAGLLGIGAFCTLPPVLAHSALATTDIAFTALFLLFMWQLVCWLTDSTPARSALLGACIGLAVAAKFTAIVFIPVASLAMIAARMWSEKRSGQPQGSKWRSRAVRMLLIAAPIGALVLWGSYRFSVGTISALPHTVCGYTVFGPEASDAARGTFTTALLNVPLPAPEFFHGLLFLRAHNAVGHSAYALGKVRQFGFWYFYPLVLLVKTPFPFMIFFAFGIACAMRRPKTVPWWVWGLFGGIPLILVSLLNSNVNIGGRHVLAIYGLAAIAAAGVIAPIMDSLSVFWRRAVKMCLGLLLVWQVGAAATSHPDFLTYFNPMSASDPGAYLADSDLDWGQGVFELEAFFTQHKAESLYVAYNGTARLCAHALPKLHALEPNTPVKGWVAISELYYREAIDILRGDPPCDIDSLRFIERTRKAWYGWLRNCKPVTILGRSIRVYYLE
jgi:hypothetical protein